MDIEKAAADYGARDAAILPLPSLSLSSKPRNKISKALKYTSKLVRSTYSVDLSQPGYSQLRQDPEDTEPFISRAAD